MLVHRPQHVSHFTWNPFVWYLNKLTDLMMAWYMSWNTQLKYIAEIHGQLHVKLYQLIPELKSTLYTRFGIILLLLIMSVTFLAHLCHYQGGQQKNPWQWDNDPRWDKICWRHKMLFASPKPFLYIWLQFDDWLNKCTTGMDHYRNPSIHIVNCNI